MCRPWHKPQLRVCVGLRSFVCVGFALQAVNLMSISLSSVSLTDHFFIWQQNHWFSHPNDLIENFQTFVQFLQRAIFSKLASEPCGGSALRMSSLTRSSLYFSKQSLRLVVFIMAKHFILQDLFIFRLGLNVSFVVCQWYIWQDDICCMTWYHIVKKERRDLN